MTPGSWLMRGLHENKCVRVALRRIHRNPGKGKLEKSWLIFLVSRFGIIESRFSPEELRTIEVFSHLNCFTCYLTHFMRNPPSSKHSFIFKF